MGRKKIIIDYEAVEKLAHLQCTIEEIAFFLGVSYDTLHRDHKFCEIYKKAREGGKMSLRRWQWQRAEKGSVPMLIWLGKQYLGQVESREEIEIRKEELRLKALQIEPKDESEIKESWFLQEEDNNMKEQDTKE